MNGEKHNPQTDADILKSNQPCSDEDFNRHREAVDRMMNGEKRSPEPWPNYDAQSLDIIIEKLIDRGYTWEGDLWKALVAQLMFEVVDPMQTEIKDLREALSELMDWQNGPPLPTYTKGWTAAMEKAQDLLNQNNQP